MKVCLFSGAFLASLLTNDATCIAITPIFVEHNIYIYNIYILYIYIYIYLYYITENQVILPLLLGIATLTNIGGANAAI